MTQYLLSVYQPDGPPPDNLPEIMADVAAVDAEMRAAGVWVFNGPLHPAASATVVKIEDGDLLTIDGPYTEGKEHLGGFSIIEAPDLDVALEWGGKLARATTLPIEVRPFQS